MGSKVILSILSLLSLNNYDLKVGCNLGTFWLQFDRVWENWKFDPNPSTRDCPVRVQPGRIGTLPGYFFVHERLGERDSLCEWIQPGSLLECRTSEYALPARTVATKGPKLGMNCCFDISMFSRNRFGVRESWLYASRSLFSSNLKPERRSSSRTVPILDDDRVQQATMTLA